MTKYIRDIESGAVPWMLLTYKIKHNRDFSEELRKARKVAEFCIEHRTRNCTLDPPPIQGSGSSDPQLFPSSLLSSSLSPSSASPSSFPLSASSAKSPNDSSIHSSTPPFSDSLPGTDSFPGKDSLFPADVRHIGLRSTISGQIIRKYSRNRDLKSAKNVKLIVPSKAVSVDREEKTLEIPCLKLLLNYNFSSNFKRISQIEIDNVYAYVAVVFQDEKPESTGRYIGVDRNTKGHIAVVADPESGKVWKLGKMRYHTHKKYENIKKRLYTKGKYKCLKAVKKREKNIVKDLNHKISRKIVDLALYSGCGIKLENLKGVKKLNSKAVSAGKCRNNKRVEKKKNQNGGRNRSKEMNKKVIKTEKHIWSNEYSLNSWSFHQLQQFIEYKSRLQGVEVVYIDPHATSKRCSRCGLTGNRRSKHFECPHCGHVDHADVNAAFNIALTPKGTGQFSAERDAGKGSPDTPQKILARTLLSKRKASEKTSQYFAWEVCQFLA
ncbi:RNA-guided endonuclease InsQ/TnpB family protein [Methanosarcina siciliae]|nr:transposase [Methanosarcina siciliae]